MATIPRPLPHIVKEFIAEVQRVVAKDDDRRATIEHLTPHFAALLADPSWLHPDFRHPVPGKFVQYAIYRADNAALSLMAMVVPSGVATPVHDHRAWGLVGVYQGRQREKVFRRLDDGSRSDFADLVQVAENILNPGDITTLLPPEGDIHMIETISEEASISIHVLGNDIGCEHRHRYDVEHQAVHRFKSGYINTSCSTYRLAHQHFVVDDVPKAVAFYEQVLGAAKVEETQVSGVPLVVLQLEGSELWMSGEIVPGLQTHPGFATDDFDAALEELRMRQVEFLGEPLEIGGQRLVLVKDSHGQQVGIIAER